MCADGGRTAWIGGRSAEAARQDAVRVRRGWPVPDKRAREETAGAVDVTSRDHHCQPLDQPSHSSATRTRTVSHVVTAWTSLQFHGRMPSNPGDQPERDWGDCF